MHLRLSILISAILLLLHPIGNAQESFRAVYWGKEQKVPPAAVYEIIKDINGFFWIGTRGAGLIRFDGNLVKPYLHHSNLGIGDRDVWALVEDSLHNIWIGSDNSLSVYDIKADTFKTVATSIVHHTSENRPFTPFWSTKDEVFFWDFPDSQLAAFDIHTFAKRTLAKIYTSDSVGNGISDINSIFDQRSNSIWVEQGNGGSPGGGLLQVSLATGKKQRFGWTCFRNIPNDDHSFEGMRYDRRRNAIWISNPDGLIEFTLSDHQFHHFDAVDSLVRVKDYHLWAGIDIDTRGRIWMGTFPKGIIIFDPSSAKLTVPFPNDSTIQENISHLNVVIYVDPGDMIWTGSWGSEGFHQLIPTSLPIKQFTAMRGKANSLSSNYTIFCRDVGEGKLWIGTDSGLNSFVRKTETFRVLRKNNFPCIKEAQAVDIQPLCTDTITQKVWILVDRSTIYQTDTHLGTCAPVTLLDSINQTVPFGQNLAVPFKNGIILQSDEKDRTVVFIGSADSSKVHQILSFPAGVIDAPKKGSDGEHWLFLGRMDSSSNLSYFLDGNKWIRSHTPLDTIPWRLITFNSADQTYWISTEKSLLHLNKEFQMIHTYSTSDGFPEVLTGRVIPDDNGNIWFTTDHSIHQLDVKTGLFTVLTEKDGFETNGFFPGLWPCKTANGDLYFSSGVYGRGFTRIRPNAYTNASPAVYIESLKVNQQPFPFSRMINSQREVSLRYFENTITIETISLDPYSRGNGRFRYKLGESSDWMYPANNIIFYSNLSPGDYDLVMQASNVNGFYGRATTLHIHISPPWWQTWWAYTLFTVVLASLLWMFIEYRSRMLRAKNVQLEEKVLHRTKELKHSLEELRETQTQLIQREKMASLGELTAGIAHEIQNPLNFMNNFSEVNAELIDEMTHELDKGNLQDAKAISKDIKDNELKINHHGKRADAIVKGMLQHSRASAGIKEPTDINALADEYLRLSYHGLRAKDKSFNAEIETQFDPALKEINVIPQDVGRVLLNIYNNAFYAANEKQKQLGASFKPVVSVTTQFNPSSNGSPAQAEIRIRDNGSGIPQKIREKIFQPFFTTKPTGEGTGLGLSLSYDIITKMHNGNLDVETSEGNGTEFIVRLPV